MGEERKEMVVVCEAGGEMIMRCFMSDEPDNEMKHEDNSFKTKFGVIFSIVLLTIVAVGCLFLLFMLGYVIKFFIYRD